MTVHVMHDIETLAVASATPVLLSLGAVKFDASGVLDRFQVRFDIVDGQRLGLEIEADTVLWWMDNARLEARVQLFSMPAVDTVAGLDGYAMWVQQTPVDQLGSAWSNGSSFDNTKLEAIYRKLHLDWPFGFRQIECYRTMRNRFSDVPFQRVGTHHGALDDAESQASHLIEIARSHNVPL